MKTKILISAGFIFVIAICFNIFNIDAKSNPEPLPFPTTVFVYNGPNPLGGADVTFKQSGVVIYGPSTTNSGGKAVLFPTVSGYYDIWAIKPGFGSGHLNNQYISGGETFYVYITDFE